MPTETDAADPIRPARPGFTEALRWWFKLGCISFGGPAGQIALMHDELVERRGWNDEEGFVRALNYCMLLPGPEAQQLATYIGWKLHGVRGGVAAGALFVLPALLLFLLLSWLYVAFQHVPAVGHAMEGLRPVVVAVIAMAAWRLGRRMLKRPAHWAIAAGGFAGLAWFHLPFPLLVALAALLGAGLLRPRGAREPVPPAAASRRKSSRLLPKTLIASALLAGGVYALLPDGLLPDMALFFTQAAFLTFGGAYAVLPYIDGAAVGRFGWLGPGQMLDGLALGETTPGPLIMIVTFVGFVGAWNLTGGDAGMALAGGLVATVFTFIPSFLLVLAGAPLIEASGRHSRMEAPLAGIGAVVIGVIAHLALRFAEAAFWPDGRFDAFSVLLAVVALVAMARFRIGVVPLMLAGLLAGLARNLFAPG